VENGCLRGLFNSARNSLSREEVRRLRDLLMGLREAVRGTERRSRSRDGR
jgi:hypothetical protein